MKRRERMIYKIILLYLVRCCVNFVLAQAVHSGAHVLCLDSRPVDISVALAVQTCVREQKKLTISIFWASNCLRQFVYRLDSNLHSDAFWIITVIHALICVL